jgi:hypothetical protein
MTADARSAYAVAIDEARGAIVARARLYKRLVIAVSLGLVAVMATTAWARSAWPLLALGLMPPLVLVHRVADLRVVHRWRARVIDSWALGALSLPLLASTLAKVPALPANTVQGMLDTLPAWPPAQPGGDDTAVLLGTQQMLGRLAEQALASRALAWLGALGVASLALASGQWAWLAALGAAAAIVPAWHWRAGMHLRRAARVSAGAGIDAARFNWNGVPNRLRKAWPAQGTG